MKPPALPDWLAELLSAIRVRPGMFLGDECVGTLMTFLAGFQAALKYSGVTPRSHRILPEFETWVCHKYSHDDAGGFVRALELAFEHRPDLWPSATRRARCPKDGSLRLFFAELDAFLATRGESLPPNSEAARKFFGDSFEG